MSRITRWNERTWFLGRNGNFRCTGIEALKLEGQLGPDLFRQDVVQLSPLDSRGMVARCSIDVPVASLPELIAELQKHVSQ